MYVQERSYVLTIGAKDNGELAIILQQQDGADLMGSGSTSDAGAAVSAFCKQFPEVISREFHKMTTPSF